VVISYCHYNLQNTLLLTKLLSVAEARGVGVLNASPLSMGLLTNQGPPPWHPALEPIKVVCRRAAKYCADNGGDIAELGMQFCFAEPRISSTITGTAKKGELEVNLKALQNPLNRELLAGVEAILKSVKDDIWPSGNWRPA
jgi:L-galactose dehydrogenase